MSVRVQKVEELLKQQISELLLETLAEEFGIISVTDVEASPDFKSAKVFIAIVQKDKEKEILQAITKNLQDYQRHLGKNLSMRYTPRLTFFIDKSESTVNRVEELLKEIDEDDA